MGVWSGPQLDRCKELHFINIMPLQSIECNRTEAVKTAHIGAHISRIKAALMRYNINDPRIILNLDEFAVSFKKVTERSLRKALTINSHRAIAAMYTTKGQLDHITIISVVNAAGMTFKYFTVCPGREVHHCVVNGVEQFPQTFLPPCKFYLR